MRNLLITLLAVIVLQGCTALPGTFGLTGNGLATGGPGSNQFSAQTEQNIQSIFVASSRKRQADGSFGFERATTLSFSTYQVAIPAVRKIGSVPPSFLGNSAEFAGREAAQFPSLSAFSRTILNETRSRWNSSEVMVFVHGFNSSFEHSLSRVAQMDLDFDFPAASILYAWPAANSLVSYIHDLDSTTFARDGLVELLTGLSNSGVSRIVLVGHSMGARLAMEAVRDIRLKGNHRFFDSLGGIVLLSPDIDADLFGAQLRALEGMKAPVVAYISSDDTTLRDFSNFFIEGRPRLGSIETIAELDGQNAVVIDVANVGDPDQKSHLAVATSPLMISAINAMSRPDLVTYAQMLISGLIPGSDINRAGQTIGVRLAAF